MMKNSLLSCRLVVGQLFTELFSLSPTVPGTINNNSSPDARFDLGTEHVVKGQDVIN